MTDAPSPGGRAAPTHLPLAGFALLAAVTLFWGANWPGMKIVLGEIGPWWFRTICLGVGGAALLAISAGKFKYKHAYPLVVFYLCYIISGFVLL